MPPNNLREQISSDLTQDNKKGTTSTPQSDIMTIIKKWGGYMPQSVSDSQLLNSMGIKGDHIPSWFVKTTKWVADGSFTVGDFENAVEYMHDKGIIR